MADAAHASFLPTILTFCAGAVIAVPLFRRFGLSAVMGYLAAGIVIGPSVLAVVKDAQTIRGIAEIGVVLLLFVVGLELQPSRLMAMRKDIFGAGTAQMVLTALVVGAMAHAYGYAPTGALALGLAMALSATAIALQILEERGDSGQPYGRRTFSILLFQDISIAPVLAVLPLLATAGAPGGWLQGLAATGLAFGAIGLVVLAGRYVLNPFFHLLAASGAREIMTAAALLIVLGAAVLMEAVGLSMAMGAFIAGVLLAESHFRHELEADIEPFRGILLGLFFMAVGMSLDLGLVMDHALPLALAAALLILIKIAIAAGLLRASCSSWTEALRAGVLLSPAGEFAFVLLPLAAALGLMDEQQAALATVLAALTMLIGPVVAMLLEMHLSGRAGPDATMDEDFSGATGSVIVIGFGRFGQVVTQTLLSRQVDVTVIDKNVERIRAATRFGFKIYFGDGTRLDVLRAAGIAKARLVCICIDDRDAAVKIAEMLKAEAPATKLHVRAYDRVEAIRLMELEVDFVTRETFEAALAHGQATLEALGVTYDEAVGVIEDVRRRDQQRLEAQLREGISARPDLVKRMGGAPAPVVTPEPLIRPKIRSKALSPETETVIAAEPARSASDA